jgi:hypothetical protein
MVTHGLGAKRDNAGAKKSPQQIQMLEKFYSGNYKLMLVSLFIFAIHFIVADTDISLIFLSRCTVSKARGNGRVCNLCWFDLQSGPYMVQRAEEKREEGDGSHWVSDGKAI